MKRIDIIGLIIITASFMALGCNNAIATTQVQSTQATLDMMALSAHSTSDMYNPNAPPMQATFVFAVNGHHVCTDEMCAISATGIGPQMSYPNPYATTTGIGLQFTNYPQPFANTNENNYEMTNPVWYAETPWTERFGGKFSGAAMIQMASLSSGFDYIHTDIVPITSQDNDQGLDVKWTKEVIPTSTGEMHGGPAPPQMTMWSEDCYPTTNEMVLLKKTIEIAAGDAGPPSVVEKDRIRLDERRRQECIQFH
ncbi:MAG: hypothetical protein KKC05_00460 [Nanoarchaeota archaeon]|nr:hypothetical protein [Nanoarchaeota archaeon]